MKYKLLKDTPTIKAGTIFEEIVNMSDETRELTVAVPGEDTPQDPQFTIQDIDNFDEWFEEIKEPTDSAHWKPKIGDRCFVLENTNIRPTTYTGMLRDYNAWRTGRVFRTKGECEKVLDRELAEVRLRKTSDFEPDFENENGGWVVFYSYVDKELHSMRDSCTDSGELVRYETEEEAKRSIKENERDWKIFFGIKEED
nr:MAG TPA: hypothetical protein [Caudoviricetes sp.]